MPNINAGASAVVSLPAGNVMTGKGAGLASYGIAGFSALTAGDPWQIGPFDKAVSLSLSASSAITYTVGDLLSGPTTPADFGLTAAQVAATQALVSGAGNVAPLLAQQARRTSILKRFGDQIGVTYANSGTAATVSIDAASPFGRPALKVAIAAGTTWAEVILSGLGVAAFDDHVIWRVWVEDYTLVQSILASAGTTGYSRLWQQTHLLSTSDTNRFNGEQQIVVGPTRCATASTFVKGVDAMAETKIRITGNGSATNVWVDAVVVPARGQGAVLLTYDDGYRSWASHVQPLLAAQGLVATFGFQQNLLGTNDALYLNSTDVAALRAAGHEIAPHQVANTRYNDGSSGTQTALQYQTDYRTSLAALRTILGTGAASDYHPYVQGGNNQALHDTLRNEGLRIARGVDNKRHNFHSAGLGRGIYAMKTAYMDNGGPDLATLQQAVDDCQTYGSTLVLMGHDFQPGATPISTLWSTELHTSLMQYIGPKVRSGALLNMTMSQYAAAVYTAGLVERQFRLEQAA